MTESLALREAESSQLLSWAQPTGWQRLLKSLGWPIALGLDLILAFRVGELCAEVHPLLGPLGGSLTFVAAVPFFIGLISTATGLGRYAPREELRQRLGQGHREGLVRRVMEELHELDPGQQGWVVIARGEITGESTFFQLRADLRTDSEELLGQLGQVWGPKLDFFGPSLGSLEPWPQSEEMLMGRDVRRLSALSLEVYESNEVNRLAGSDLDLRLFLFHIDGSAVPSPPRVFRLRTNNSEGKDSPQERLFAKLCQLANWELP